MKHARIKIHGKVQGVFFRQSTKETAHDFNILGFVRNEPDGTVYIEAEGNTENLEKFINWCWDGPPAARVDSVDYDYSMKLKNFEKFEIR